ncbi:molybdenum cofactor guanylyltransferase [Paracoccaceae bacterium]|nr:molybdenum cofactor guanylyltransferase [Paracoccaceae bacterium]
MFEGEIPAVILSGGQSKRMDRNDKAFLSISDQNLLEMVVGRLKRQTPKVAINTNSNNPKYLEHGLPILKDHFAGFLGPLAGIFAAMNWANDMGYEKVLTVAVDTPLFPEILLEKLNQNMKVSNSDIVFAASVPEDKQKKVLHPVFGLWKTFLFEDLRKQLEKGVRKVTCWSERHIASSECFSDERIDPFFNINTPHDIMLLKEYLRNK